MKKLFLYLSIFVLAVPAAVQGQSNDTENLPTPHIRVKAGVQQGKISLRWAVDEAVAWQKANKIGFVVKRYTLTRDGKLLPDAEEENLGTFLPAAEKQWQTIVETNDNAAIVAQALFGEDFEVEMGEQKPSGVEGIINKSQEIDQRFSFALMAADLDFKVACLAGWGLEDTSVKEGEKYVYIVELNSVNNTRNLVVERGQAVVSLDEKTTPPAPLGFIGIFQDKTVTLAWEYLQLRDFYTSYYIEKSEDGAHFQPLGDVPVMNMNDQSGKQAPGMIYIDSLTQNGKNYSYRIRGKTIFGEYGPYSNIISGAGKKGVEAAPRITSAVIGKDETVKLDWEFPQEAEKDITSFELIYSESDREGTYKTLKNKIPASDRTIATKSQSPSNYFKIRAVGKNNDYQESFAVLVQPDDDTPPAAPLGLMGKIDSLGVVRLQWKPNAEKDFAGYHVFRSTQEGEELVRITPQAVMNPQYTDTVQLKYMNPKVWYYVTAIDQRKNQSAPSQIIELEKPDIIKPEAPVITQYKLEDGTIQLFWTKSYSEDAAVHRLYRQALDDEDKSLKIIYETKELKPDYDYTDKEVTADHRYKYYLQAVDRHGLVSDKSQEVTLRCTDLRPAEVIKNITVSTDRNKKMIRLLWKTDSKEVSEIIVYRQKAGEKATMWGSLPGAQNFLEDKDVQPGTQYTYLLKAMLKTNQPTKTEKITVEY